MIKIPSLEDLKKAGAGLVDSAKSANIGGAFEKLKSSLEGKNDAPATPSTGDPIKAQLQTIQTSLTDLAQMQTAQTALTKNIESQLATLAKIIELANLPPAPPIVAPLTPKENEKPK